MSFSATQSKSVDHLDFQRLLNIDAAKSKVKISLLVTWFTGGTMTLFGLITIALNQHPSWAYLLMIEPLFVFAMGYGISRYNLICSRLMFGYFVLSSIVCLFSGLGGYGLYCRFLLIAALWKGTLGMESYHHLMSNDRVNEVIHNEVYGDNNYPEASTTLAEPLAPTAELIALCNGDRAEAQWLLAKVKGKNPQESVAWCNEQVIQKLQAAQA
jgi:hypothetical protein